MKKKFFSIVGYNAAEIFLIFELKYFHENKFFSKMFLTHESGAREDQFDGKKWRPKISWYYPFNKFIEFGPIEVQSFEVQCFKVMSNSKLSLMKGLIFRGWVVQGSVGESHFPLSQNAPRIAGEAMM